MLTQLQERFDTLEHTRRHLLTQLANLSSNQLAFQPAKNRWSILHVMEHLILSEEQTCHVVSRQLANPRLSHQGNWHLPLRLWVMKRVLRSQLRFKVPIESVVPSGDLNYQELTARWDEARQQLAHVLERFDAAHMDQPVLRHTFFGLLPIGAVLQFLQEHFNHHLHQIRRIRKSRNFPAD